MSKDNRGENPLNVEIFSMFTDSSVGCSVFNKDDLVLEFANDSFLNIVGKGKDIVGKPFFDSFKDEEDFDVKSILLRVIGNGNAVTVNEHMAKLKINGTMGTTYHNIIFQPITDANDIIEGVLCLYSDVTNHVTENRSVSITQQELESKLKNSIDEIRQNTIDRNDRAAELVIANKELASQIKQKEKRAAELVIANQELASQNDEKEKRAAELVIANKELAFQNHLKEKRARELVIANQELAYQNDEKEKRAAELVIANKELASQNDEKEKRAAELVIANKELASQNNQKEKRAAELVIANKELVFQNEEKEKRAAELVIANKELVFQNNEKEKKAAELVVANKELAFQNELKEKRASELVIANEELAFQNDEKEKRAAELVIANKELDSNYVEIASREMAFNVLEATNSASLEASLYTRRLIEAITDPLFTINSEGKIVDINLATIQATDVTKDKLIGSNFIDYFTDQDKASLVCQEIFKNDFIADVPLIIKDHKLTDVLLNGSVYKNEEGEVIGAVIVARDVTEQKLFEKQLIEAKVFAELATNIAEEAKNKAEGATHIAELAVKSKQQFLSNMSHEIRTPMNAIIGFTKVVLKTELSAKQKEYLTAIKMSGDALIVLINDILDLAKVDAGKMLFENISFRMENSIASMLHLFETKVQEKNLKLIKVYDARIPDVLIGDPVRLHQIILNLVSNAVKFTSEGDIMVGVELEREFDERVTIKFSVKDTGMGISDDKIDTIFENFQQASSGTTRLYGGTGLGLAIVKQLVESQGGQVMVESVLDKGSTFSFVLDFAKTTENPEFVQETVLVSKEIKNINILVVEDIALNQLLIKTLLDDFGFASDITSNGKLAVEKLKTSTYDVILMDLQMPEMNGFEATDYIRNVLKLTVPIIALTADVTTVDLAKCTAVGMNDYVAKPVDEKVLYTKILSHVNKSASDANEKVKVEKDTKGIIQKCTNLTYLNHRTKSNPKLMMEMIDLYLLQTPPLITEMKKSFESQDWDMLHAAVHKMIPSFVIIGINADFENMAKKIQEYASMQIKMGEIKDLVSGVENVCLQACKELEDELKQIKMNL